MLPRWVLLLPLFCLGAASNDAPLLYLPFDGAADAVVSGGEARERAGAQPGFVPGVRGQAAVVNTDLRYDSAANFRPAEGTCAFWLRPNWAGDSPTGRYLFSLYGGADTQPRWSSNRWGISTAAGRITFTFYSALGKGFHVSAPIAGWKAGEWHHVAVTWRGVGSGKPDGELHLFLDGKEAGTPVTGADLPVEAVASTLDVGRDSDGSPDYADAALDDLYLYGRALRAEEIARAVDAARSGKEPAVVAAAPAARQPAPGWADPERPYRARVTIPAEKHARDRVFAQLPLDLAADLARLGRPGAVDPAWLLLLPDPGGKESGRVGERESGGKGPGAPGARPAAGRRAHSPTPPFSHSPVPVRLRDNRIEWLDGALPAGQERRYALYFRTVAYDCSVPLLARVQAGAGQAPAADVRIPDYATEAYGNAWDFDEGDLDGIDQWGNRPEFIQRKVEDGLLKLDVKDDPWFVWGDMWGQVQRSQRPVKIDLARYPVLEMRVRQSVDSATWQLYGRPTTSDNLLSYEFPVSGAGWQTIRIDLRRQARWSGTLCAFRIDPTNGPQAHVEIDWVRLTPVRQAGRGAVEALGEPSAPAKSVAVVPASAQPRVGAQQVVAVRVTDAAGKHVAGQPVRLALLAGSGGALDAAPDFPSLECGKGERRAITGADGSARFGYRASRKAGTGADTLEATAEFAGLAGARRAIATGAGPAHHYAVSPTQPLMLRPGGPKAYATEIVARLADEFGNPLPGGGRVLTWSAPGARLTQAEAHTRADGSAIARFQGDPATRWVTQVTVKDEKGLEGQSAAICVLPAGPRPAPVQMLPNGYFTAAGKPWLPLGGFYANWVGAATPDGEWRQLVSFTDATEEQTIAWLRFLKESGVTAQRFMLRTHRKDGMEPMDIGGRVNPGLFAAFLRYLDLARPFGIRFLLVLHEDYTKPIYYNTQPLERWALPLWAGQNLDALPPFQRRFVRDRALIEDIGLKYTDPDVMACQDRYAREIIGLLKDNPQVFAYELENEMVNCPASWANHAIATIRSVDPKTPVCVSHGGGGLHTADPAWWKEKTSIDFYSYHLYPPGSTSPLVDYGAAIDVLTRYGRMGKPAFLGESAGDEFSTHPDRETRRWVMRDIIWFSLANGNPGCFFWNARGSEVAEFRLANEVASRIDWSTFQRRRPAIAVAVPHSLENDKWFRTPVGQAAYAMMGRYARHYLDRGVEFAFAIDAGAYPLRAGVEQFAPPEPPASEFVPSPGYQLKPLVAADGKTALLYVRNLAGVEFWESKERHPRRMHLRTRKPAPLQVKVNLPGRFQAEVWDLDTGRREQRPVAAGDTLDLGTTDHDFAVLLRRET